MDVAHVIGGFDGRHFAEGIRTIHPTSPLSLKTPTAPMEEPDFRVYVQYHKYV
jgi:hypothetical protein